MVVSLVLDGTYRIRTHSAVALFCCCCCLQLVVIVYRLQARPVLSPQSVIMPPGQLYPVLRGIPMAPQAAFPTLTSFAGYQAAQAPGVCVCRGVHTCSVHTYTYVRECNRKYSCHSQRTGVLELLSHGCALPHSHVN